MHSGLLGNNVNYTIITTTESSVILRLTPGSYWRKNFENLPGALTVLAVNAGQGYVAVGPTNSGKARDIAMVFERPVIYSSSKKLFKTHSHDVHIKGEGFPDKSSFKVALKFSPPLIEETGYTVKVIDRTDLKIILLDGRSWRVVAGPLLISAINTRGDDSGWITLPGMGVHIADVVDDLDDADETLTFQVK